MGETFVNDFFNGKERKLKVFGFCSKVKAEFDVKENIMPIFRPKRQIPYALVDIIDKELGRLEKLGVIEKTDYSPSAALTVCGKKT